MRVYRYERDGIGPYQTAYENAERHLMDNDHSYGNSHPMSWADGISHYLPIACKSIPDLKRWFDGWHGMLVKQGFRIRIYDVPMKNIEFGNSGKQLGYAPWAIRRTIR